MLQVQDAAALRPGPGFMAPVAAMHEHASDVTTSPSGSDDDCDGDSPIAWYSDGELPGMHELSSHTHKPNATRMTLTSVWHA